MFKWHLQQCIQLNCISWWKLKTFPKQSRQTPKSRKFIISFNVNSNKINFMLRTCLLTKSCQTNPLKIVFINFYLILWPHFDIICLKSGKTNKNVFLFIVLCTRCYDRICRLIIWKKFFLIFFFFELGNIKEKEKYRKNKVLIKLWYIEWCII